MNVQERIQPNSWLGGVAVFLIRKNTMSLLGRTIPSDKHTLFMSILEKDPVVRAVIDAKAVRLT
jgi:hypothetical protein